MKYLALMKKELRMILPWAILAAAVFTLIGTVVMCVIFKQERDVFSGYNWNWKDESLNISWWQMRFRNPFGPLGAWLFFISIGLGLILAVRQFWMPNFSKTKSFELHRPINRGWILSAKLLSAMLVMTISVGGVWVAFYRIGHHRFPNILITEMLIQGWIFIAIGYVVYLCLAVCGTDRSKWYATKKVPIVLAILIFITTFTQVQIYIALGIIGCAMAVLMVQLASLFLNRDYS